MEQSEFIHAADDPFAVVLPEPRGTECLMPLMNVILTLVVIGVLLWLVNTYIPMDAKIKQIVNAVAVIGTVLWVVNVFGLFGHLGNVRVGKS